MSEPNPPAQAHNPAPVELVVRDAEIGDLPTLKLWYSSPEARKFLYATPPDPTEFALYILKPHRFIVEKKTTGATVPVGTFSLEASGTNARVGVLIGDEHRGTGLFSLMVPLIEREAEALGIRVLSADIYSDNEAAIRGFGGAGFRKFLWFEKNIDLHGGIAPNEPPPCTTSPSSP